MLILETFFFLAFLFHPFLIQATYTEVIPISSYGWLNQFSMNNAHHFVGNEACVWRTLNNSPYAEVVPLSPQDYRGISKPSP